MRTQNDINLLYRPKSLEEIKAEIQNSRTLGLNFQREENTVAADTAQSKREKTKVPNVLERDPMLTFIIGAISIAVVLVTLMTVCK